MTTLDRHTIDRIARAVVSGRRGHGRQVDALADTVASRMKGSLAACAAPGLARAERLAVRPFDDAALFDVLVARTRKHLASEVVTRSRARARPA